MNSIKVIFFDVQEYEKSYILNNKPQNCDFILREESLHTNFKNKIADINDADIISVFTSSRVPKEYLEKFKNLKLVTTRSTGFSHIDIEFCADNNIPVVNVPRYGDSTVAEYTFGLLLDIARKINIAHKDLQSGKVNIHQYIGMDLHGKTIGIIGTGAIGSNAVSIAKGFNMHVLAYDPYPKAVLKENYNVKYVELEELIKTSDIISIHCPATKSNYHLLDEKEFDMMKDGVVIVNTARGEIINTNALYKALLNKKVKAAGLDVVECEEMLANEEQYLVNPDCIKPECLKKTLINHKLLELPNVVITPHVAFDTQEAIDRILKTTLENIYSFNQENISNKVY